MKTFNIFSISFLAALSLLVQSCGKGNGDHPYTPVDYSSTTGVDKFGEENIFCRNVSLHLPKMCLQFFDITSDGDVWYSQNETYQNFICRTKPHSGREVSVQNDDYMTVQYAGHGSFSIEEAGDERYVWMSCYGSAEKTSVDGLIWYASEKLIGRVRYQKGKTIKTSEMDEYYYIGPYSGVYPQICEDGRYLLVHYGDTDDLTQRAFRVYDMEKVRGVSETREVPIEITAGLINGDYRDLTKKTVLVKCKDLTSIKPEYIIKFPKKGYAVSENDRIYDFQGYAFFNKRLYILDGQNSKSISQPESQAYLTVFDERGFKVERRTRIAATEDAARLEEMCISYENCIEAEGLLVKNGKLYIGFAGDNPRRDAPSGRYQNIFQYNISSK